MALTEPWENFGFDPATGLAMITTAGNAARKHGLERKAVEELFDVQVASVHIVNRKGKPIMRYGRVANHRPAVRKAYVKLAPGSKNLEFFEGV